MQRPQRAVSEVPLTSPPPPAADRADALTRLAFSVHGNPGVYALLLGSGLSRSAGLLTGWEITLDLVRHVALAQGEVDQPDWAAWHKEKFGREPNYSELIAQLGPSPHERRAILNSYIDPTEEDVQLGRKMPTKAHRAIADLVRDGMVRVIITTNFDRLLEQALSERGIQPTVVDSVHAANGAEPIAHSKCYLVKLHGDYKDARILNTDEELSQYAPEFKTLLDRIFDDHGLIVCGWSGEWDIALLDAITSNPSRRYSMYWATRGPVGDAAQRIIAHRRGQLVSITDADEFFGDLKDQVHTLTRTQRQIPENVDLLVSTAKRFAAHHEHRIDLHDLIESEAQRCIQSLLTSTPEVDATAKGLEQLAAFQESSVERLARMLGVLGRWGDGTEHSSVINALLAVWFCTDDGNSGIAHLRRYPAVLLLWAYGIGLTLAKRWRDLHSLLLHQVSQDQGDPQSLVRVVSDWILAGYRNKIWKHLPGLQRHYAPDSEHLYEVLNEWRESFAAVQPDFEDQQDIWEILFAIVYRESVVDETTGTGMRFWTPIGRNGWRHRSRERVLARITNGNLHAELISAGLAGGNANDLITIAEDYSNFVAKLNWG